MPSCADCVYFEPHALANKKKGHTGLCKRFPPQPGAGHPRVESTDWCGEHKSKEKLK